MEKAGNQLSQIYGDNDFKMFTNQTKYRMLVQSVNFGLRSS